ncbi:HD domain-containing protein [Halobacillus seohaensis]|uniref:HD domain-containing protein n=1 Tax=Halobacillus seohaensis TaxID=447421 RepID=A0ABW2EKT9_9BACI
MIKKAEEFAFQAHQGQKRKCSDEDYIVHPIRVAKTLQLAGGSTELICAGFLHDVVEDTPYDLEDIKKEFGERVRYLVDSHTEDKTQSWQARKSHTIETVKGGCKDIKSLIIADKLDNLLSIEDQYQKIGETIWSQFNAGYEQQKWYYQSVENMMRKGIPSTQTPAFFKTYSDAVQRFFA